MAEKHDTALKGLKHHPVPVKVLKELREYSTHIAYSEARYNLAELNGISQEIVRQYVLGHGLETYDAYRFIGDSVDKSLKMALEGMDEHADDVIKLVLKKSAAEE